MNDLSINSGEATDLLIWQRILKGDQKALGMLYERYYLILLNYGLRYSIDRELVKDAIQDLFVRIYHNTQIAPDVTVRSYLLRSLRNILLNYLTNQKEGADIELYAFHIPEDENLFERLFPRNDKEQRLAKRLLKALSQLPSHQKHMLYMRYVNELSHQEIADLMDMNVQSSKNLLSRAMSKLRILMDRGEDLLLIVGIVLSRSAEWL